jgi:flagellum-specific ATP synthase
MPDITTPAHREAALGVRELLAAYHDHEDLISIGAYRCGANPRVDTAIAMLDQINAYLRQGVGDVSTAAQTQAALLELIARSRSQPQAPAAAGQIAAHPNPHDVSST